MLNTPLPISSRPISHAYSSKLAAYYPTVDEQARIDQAGELSKEKLEAILTGQLLQNESDASTILPALSGLHHPLFWEVGFYYCRQHYSHQTMYGLLECMITHPEKNDHMNFFIEKYIEFEDCSYIKDMICCYL